jgi:hypothetical protein
VNCSQRNLSTQVDRLQLYLNRARLKLGSADKRIRQNALADISELGEISRRLYLQLKTELNLFAEDSLDADERI